MNSRALRIIVSLAGLAALTVAAHWAIPVNATTAGFAYLLLVLAVASIWGFVESFILSIAATLCFNYYFLPPVGTFTIAENWMALCSFLTSSLIASRLSTAARQRTLDAVARQQDLERLYTFSRAILLVEGSEPFPAELVRKLAEIFELDGAVLYDRRSGKFYRAGPSELPGVEDPLRETALHGVTRLLERSCILTAVRLGSEPIASLAIGGARMPDSVLQGIANLVAIGLERAQAQELASQVEAARRSERLRTTLIDAMAHEFKTPLTSIRATTTLLLAGPDPGTSERMELLKIADEEAKHLGDLIDDTVAIARLDTGHIQVEAGLWDIFAVIGEVLESLKAGLEGRSVEITRDGETLEFTFDRHLIGLAIKQLVDNAVKYSPPGSPLGIRVRRESDAVEVTIRNQGKEIPAEEQGRIFERFYRSPSVQSQIPGSGLGLSIAQNILRAHGGDLGVKSESGWTAFRMVLPAVHKGEPCERGANSGH